MALAYFIFFEVYNIFPTYIAEDPKPNCASSNENILRVDENCNLYFGTVYKVAIKPNKYLLKTYNWV